MTSPQWRRVDELLDQAMELPTAERAAFLDRECDGDNALRREVESLLAAHDKASGFFDSQPAALADDLIRDRQAEALVGHAIGPYRIVREIGRGGMGVVYLAERTDDQYRRQVAVKLLWPGLLNTEIVRRFRRERQILANLDHPNVAKLFDGGTTEEGWPYFVMEYVAGQPITEYCNARRLSVAERLRLFQQVCAAVQYAHQTLIIHRDLKPGNILVTEDGTAKLLDFGIAKLLDPARHAVTAQPTTNALMMTPDYASPEQMRGEAITTASDVYSLGILLYELLTGGHPYQIKDRSLPELVRVVCEQEPEAPSQRVGQFAKLPHGLGDTKPERLRAQLRGDLDQITQTAIQKDANVRYRSVEQLSEDLRRHLEGLPVIAHKPTFRYHAIKFVRRNQLGVTVALITSVALVGGILVTMRQANVAQMQASVNGRLTYAAQMHQAMQAWEFADILQLRELVEKNSLQAVEEDLRDFEWYYLWRLYNYTGERLSLPHPVGVWSAAFAPDGRRIATGTADGKLRMWDADTGRELVVLSGHEENTWAIAFSPHGQRLVTGGGYRTAKLWDVTPRHERELTTFIGHANEVRSVAFSPDGKRLATSSFDYKVKVWNVQSGRELLNIQGHGGINAVKFSSDGQLLATGHSYEPAIELWDASTGQKLRALDLVGGASSIAFSPDGKSLVAGGRSRVARLWEVSNGKLHTTLLGHDGVITAVAFSPDGKMLATGSADRTVRLWDVFTGEELVALKGHLGSVMSLDFSADGKNLVTCGADGTARLWDIATVLEFTASKHFNLMGRFVAFSPDGKKLAVISPSGDVRVLDATTGQEFMTFSKFYSPVRSLAFSPDGKRLITNYGSVAKVWDIDTGRELITFHGHILLVNTVAFSHDGQSVATASDDKTVKIWRAATGQELLTLNRHDARVRSIIFSPDGKILVSGGSDNTARVWDTTTGLELAVLNNHTAPLMALAFSPDGKILATGSADKTVRLWEVLTARELSTFRGHAGSINCLAFAPNGKRLATGGSEGLVRLWDVANGQEVIALKGHTDSIVSIAFSPDGQILTSASQDGTVRFWRAATPQEVAARGRQSAARN